MCNSFRAMLEITRAYTTESPEIPRRDSLGVSKHQAECDGQQLGHTIAMAAQVPWIGLSCGLSRNTTARKQLQWGRPRAHSVAMKLGRIEENLTLTNLPAVQG